MFSILSFWSSKPKILCSPLEKRKYVLSSALGFDLGGSVMAGVWVYCFHRSYSDFWWCRLLLSPP